MDYTVHKQTYVELTERYGVNEKTLRKYFDQLEIEKEYFKPNNKEINITLDTTFLKGSEGFGVTVFRAEGKNIYWEFCETERLINYSIGLNIIDKEYKLISFTIDNRRGLRQLLQKRYGFNVPIQYCHFHQVQTVTKYTTKKPKTECGKDLRKLILDLKKLNEKEFTDRFNNLKKTYNEFLKERNENNEFMHQNLRKAFRSVNTNLPYLFTFENHLKLNIPTTANSADGSFPHWKKKVKLHNGIRRKRKQKMINNLLKN